jgi:hypothetical protein
MARNATLDTQEEHALNMEDLFRSLEAEMTETHLRDVSNRARSTTRILSELAAVIEVDAIEAGLPKDVARRLSLAVLERVTGLNLR